MRQMAHRPYAGRPLEGEGVLQPRELTEDDVELVRDAQGAWNPQSILERFGPAPEEACQLGHLMVGCAVLAGAHRVRDVAERLVFLASGAQPRVRRLLEDDSVRPRRAILRELLSRLNGARQELAGTRARAANDEEGGPAHLDGLRFVDLKIISDHVRTQVMAHELVSRRNVVGIDFGLRYAQSAPQLEYAQDWLERLTGSSSMENVILFWPREYGRVVIVHEDGRLAYDPGAPYEDETSDEHEGR